MTIILILLRFRLYAFLFFLFHSNTCICQIDSANSLQFNDAKIKFHQKVLRKELILPVTFMTFGVVSIKNPYIKTQNTLMRDNLQDDHLGNFPIDDYTQYLPAASYFALDLMGVRAKHKLKSRLYAAAFSHALMAGAVNLMKGSIPITRPDFSANNSFPSGHTATAFVGAELIWQEYSHQSIWYGIGAYSIAAGTGFFRMYNNRHWFSDVVMGAGIGILCTKTAYWLMPIVEDKFLKKKNPYLLYPSYQTGQVMVNFSYKL